jgi:hypothetical protein
MLPAYICRNIFILFSRLIRRTRAIPCSSGVLSLTHCCRMPKLELPCRGPAISEEEARLPVRRVWRAAAHRAAHGEQTGPRRQLGAVGGNIVRRCERISRQRSLHYVPPRGPLWCSDPKPRLARTRLTPTSPGFPGLPGLPLRHAGSSAARASNTENNVNVLFRSLGS